MRSTPDDDDLKDLEELNPLPWQPPLLAMNPGYTCWGPVRGLYVQARGGRGIRPSR